MSLAIFYFTYYALNMFRTLIYPSSAVCDCVDKLPHRSYCSVKTDVLAISVPFTVCSGVFGVMLVFHSSTIAMIHGPINIRLKVRLG